MSSEMIVRQKENTVSPSAQIIDVGLEPFNVWRTAAFAALLFGAGALLVSGLAIAASGLNLPNSVVVSVAGVLPYVLLIALVALILFVQLRRDRVAYRCMTARLKDHPGEPIAQSARSVLGQVLRRRFMGFASIRRGRRFRAGTMHGLRGVARALAHRSHRDLTIRACKPEFAVPIQPIEVPIEPLPLDESVPFVGQLGDGDQNDFDTGGSAERQAEVEADGSCTLDESDFRRKLKRRISLIGGRWVFGLFLFAWAINALNAVVAWRITWPFVLWTAMLAVFAFGVGGRGAWRSSQQWLIVPGGLVTRRANRRGGWDVHLFDRRASVLTAYRHTRNHWFICVADEHTDQIAVVTPTESIALLRTWLSPLDPPPVERLQELAGE